MGRREMAMRRVLVVLAAFGVLAAACGNEESPPAATESCVMPGTPSNRLSSRTPCQCTVLERSMRL